MPEDTDDSVGAARWTSSHLKEWWGRERRAVGGYLNMARPCRGPLEASPLPSAMRVVVAALSFVLLSFRLPAQVPVAGFVPWRSLMGEVAIDLRVLANEVRIGFAGDTAQVTLVLRPSDLRGFADSIIRRLAATRDRRSWSFRIEEPGVSAGAMSVSGQRDLTTRTWSYRLFAADDVLRSVTDSLGAAEVRVFARKLRQAAQAAAPPPARRRPARKPNGGAPAAR